MLKRIQQLAKLEQFKLTRCKQAAWLYIKKDMKPYNRTTALILIAALLCAMPVGALEVKDFTFSHLGKAEGVDNQRIFSVCQTTSGAIWWSSMMGVGL